MCGAVEGMRAGNIPGVVIGYPMGGGLAPHRGTGMARGSMCDAGVGEFPS